jgi:hypothetical protein
MWCTVLVLALVATVDPVRLGISVLLYSRHRPVPHLVAFWLGGLTISAVVAVGVLFGLRDFALGVMHRVQFAAASSTAGGIQIAMGVLVLLIAALAAGLLPRQRTRLVMPGADPSHLQVLTSTAFSRLSMRVHDALKAGPLWVPFVLGVGMLLDLGTWRRSPPFWPPGPLPALKSVQRLCTPSWHWRSSRSPSPANWQHPQRQAR